MSKAKIKQNTKCKPKIQNIVAKTTSKCVKKHFNKSVVVKIGRKKHQGISAT